jgi:phenylacetate-CoA ligase
MRHCARHNYDYGYKMTEFFDALETQSQEAREASLFKALPNILTKALLHAPALAKQLGGIDVKTLKNRAALAQVPVLRKSELIQMQADNPPFGGLVGVPLAQLKRFLVSPGPINDPEGSDPDWWGAGRAFYAAGFRESDVVLNTFSYHMTPGAHIMETGAQAVGCPVIPAGTSSAEAQLDVITSFKPTGYAGTPDFLKILIDKASDQGKDIFSLKKAFVSGAAFPPSLQAFMESKGIVAYQCYATADLGVVAYESQARGGLIINENIIVEIVRVGTNEAVEDGEVGEIVVTRLNQDYPLLRFGTGDLSKIIEGTSPCGRSNKRLAGWMGRADQTAKVKGMFVRPEQINEVLKRHSLAQGRLIISRENELDAMRLQVLSGDINAIALTLQEVTKLKGKVELVKSLKNDGKVIEDTRPV